MITHTVFFTLTFPKGSVEEKEFFDAASKLAIIPGVTRFDRVRQISTKNTFAYGLTMQFSTQDLYTAYTNHPDHTQFVKTYWSNYVADFMEIDYVSF
jgi:hypothetical protein